MGLHDETDFERFGVVGKGNHHKNKSNEPVPANIGLQNPRACIAACYKLFVDGISNDTQGDLEDVCNQLSHFRSNTELWKLYCCDSTFCGVRIPEKGQDPNVDLIINECQNIGNYLIYDPGPPPPSKSNCESILTKLEEPESQTILSSNGPSSITTTISTTLSATTAASLSSEHNSTVSGVSTAPSTSGLTEGSKAAIGICSSLAIIAIIFLGGFLISRRRSHPRSFLDGIPNESRLGRPPSEPQSGHTPFITPPNSASSKGPPLTPPARLSDRKFLPSLLYQDDTSNSNADQRVLIPTTLDMSMDERNTLSRKGHIIPNTETSISLSPPAAVHFAPRFLRDSNSSNSSGPMPTSAPIGSNKDNSMHPSPLPLSPTRPQRPHDEPIEIPHLVTPAGPPPNRALPAPPPYHPTSPTFPVSPVSAPNSPPPHSVKAPSTIGDENYTFGNFPGGEEYKRHLETSTIGIALPASVKDGSTSAQPYETSQSRIHPEGKIKNRGKSHESNIGGYKMGENGSTVSLQDLIPRRIGDLN
ncbi:hypothetical protein F5Y11DRAFT_261818 [Daldinia sp. FL1419]|nr:hypothetical protein F5Y11DRAFT_261818 [Daldinia sp. FL1419]